MNKEKILIVFPTLWDIKQLKACRAVWEDEYEILFSGPMDHDCDFDFNVFRYIDTTINQYRGQIQGVFSTSDYPGIICAAVIARELGLPSPTVESVLNCSHKYYSRYLQMQIAPEATPWFELIDPKNIQSSITNIDFPCFVKPVKGAFSRMTRQIHTAEELNYFIKSPKAAEFLEYYLAIFDELFLKLTHLPIGGRYFLAEELLHGQQVTVEGFATQDEIKIIGISDSILYPNTNSFMRFDYPSLLATSVQLQMHELACKVISHSGLTNTLFNIEMMYEPQSQRISIIEINPRMCAQFADLYEKINKVNSFKIALDLAAGKTITYLPPQSKEIASSITLRLFEPTQVLKAPCDNTILNAEQEFSGTLILNECQTGDRLNNFVDEDGASIRYAVINLKAEDNNARQQLLNKITKQLNYEFISVE